MKNVQTELTKYNKHILEIYEDVKRKNLSDYSEFPDYDNRETETGLNDESSGPEEESILNEPSDTNIETIEPVIEEEKMPVLSLYSSSSSSDSELLEVSNLPDFNWKGIPKSDIIKMLPKTSINTDDSNYKHAFRSIEQCNYSLGLDENLEFYFSASQLAKLHNFEYFKNILKNNNNNNNLSNSINQSKYFNDIDSEYRIDSDASFKNEHLNIAEYLKVKEENLLNLRKLKSLCKWDKEMLQLLISFQREKNQDFTMPCYFSLPQSIAILNNKTDCTQLDSNDVRHFIEIIRDCYDLQKTGILYAAAEEYKQKPEIINLLNKNNPISKFVREPFVRNNICFKKNLLHIIYEYLVDNEFLSINTSSNVTSQSFNVKISTLLVINGNNNKHLTSKRKQFDSELMFDFYLKYFHYQRYNDKETNLAGINLMGIRQEAAMRFISQEMSLVGLAIILIVTVTLLYLKSVVLSMIVNLGVGMSVGVAFFAYRIVFDIDLFPFINMMAAFLLIGIACDNVYVLFDSWYSEKAKIIMEDLPFMIEKQYSLHNNNHNNNNNNNKDINVVDVQPLDEYLLPAMFVERQFIKSEKKKPKKNSKVVKYETNSSENDNESFLNNNNNNNNKLELDPKDTSGNNAINIELLQHGITLDELNKYELNPAYVRLAPLSDEQMIRIMGGTLRHAASSIFVTSFTTAAAFLTNYITKLPYVQLFGVFTGTCIIVYFTMVITMVAAFVITYEKHIQLWRCKLRPQFTNKIEEYFEKSMGFLALLNYKAVSKSLPRILIRFRFAWFGLFLTMGIIGMIAVFYYPQLKPPATWRYQFFKTGNLFEEFEFKIRDRFWSYVNEEKRNLTNPEIFFVFGIMNKDTGRVFNPDDDGFLLYDKNFDFLAPESQTWLNSFINVSLASRRDLFLVDEIVTEWTNYLKQMQQFCYKTMELDRDEIAEKIFLPYKRESLSKCQEEVKSLLVNSSIANFEYLMSSFPRRIIFMSKGQDVSGILLRVNSNRTFADHATVREYYEDLKKFHDETFKNAPKGFDTGWFISIGFALFDLQNQLIDGTYSSLVASMIIALIILLLTSGNFIISMFAIVTISFSISVTIAIFVFMGWSLSILESVIIIMSVGLSVDFSCHYGVAYINSDVKDVDQSFEAIRQISNEPNQQQQQQQHDADIELQLANKSNSANNHKQEKTGASCKLSKFVEQFIKRYKENDKERFIRINDIFSRVGSAVLMAAFTTFLAGFSMYPSGLISFSQMGQFLMLVMCTSYLYATFFFVPLCAIFGPTKNFGAINFGAIYTKLLSMCKSKNNNNTNTNNNSNNSNRKSNLKRNKSNGKEKIILFNDNEDANAPAASVSPSQQ